MHPVSHIVDCLQTKLTESGKPSLHMERKAFHDLCEVEDPISMDRIVDIGVEAAKRGLIFGYRHDEVIVRPGYASKETKNENQNS